MSKKKINIAICDDDVLALRQTEDYIKRCENEVHISFDISLYTNPLELLKVIDVIHILFLDVEMPAMDGFQVAVSAKEKNPDILLIFLTNHDELVQNAFKVNAFRYLYKPSSYADIFEVLHEAVSELDVNIIAVIDVDKNIKYVRVKEIYYIESLGDYSAIHLENGCILTRKSLKDWIHELGDGFCRCHKSYAINLYLVQEVLDDKLKLINGEVVLVSVRNRNRVKNVFHEHIKKNARFM